MNSLKQIAAIGAAMLAVAGTAHAQSQQAQDKQAD